MSRFLVGYLLTLLMMKIECPNSSQLVARKKMMAKIVGGVPVSMEKFPSMVQLYNLGNMCAGNIVNSWTILTAAHCFDFNQNVEEVVIQKGKWRKTGDKIHEPSAHHLSSKEKVAVTSYKEVKEAALERDTWSSRFVYDFNADTYGTDSIIVHHKYNETRNFACDVALVFLERPIKFTKEVKKGILAYNKKWMHRRETGFSVSGWGWTEYGGELSKKGLMMTYLRFIPSDECGRLHDLVLTEDLFCLYGEGKRDTCKGDSGGGVLWKGMIVGVTSHGDGCARKDKPSVYANVYYFRKWIKQHINSFFDRYCMKPKRRPYIYI